VYVHGWHHNAGQTDSNVRQFKCTLSALQGIESNVDGDVIGIYVGWRGASLTVPGLRHLTFWERKNTSEEVGRGSLVEFLTVLERTVKPDPDTRNKLLMVGHSFGASAVFNAIGPILLARFLLDTEALASDRLGRAHSQSQPGLVTGYGDLVVLVNPAIEATRLMPFFGALSERTSERPELLAPGQPPRLVILSSEGDWATRKAFPAARVFSTLFESYGDLNVRTPYGTRIALNQRRLDWQAMGNVGALYTHEPLRQRPPQKDWTWDGKCPTVDRDWLAKVIQQRREEQESQGQRPTGAGWSRRFAGVEIQVTHRAITTPSNPLWVMAVGTELIPDHDAIANPALMCFFDELVGDVQDIKRQGGRHHEYLQTLPK
jgi:hypothetical protein